MGSYFSLHDAAFWEATIDEAPHPSIWSNVHHSPLAVHQRLMLERPGRVSFSFSSGLRQGGSAVQVSENSTVSLLCGFEETTGRLYSGLLLSAAQSMPHRYGREMEEVVLSHPAARGGSGSPTSGGGSPTATRRRQEPLEMEKLNLENPMQETEWPYLLLYAVKEGVLLFFTQDAAECEEIVREVALSFGGHHPVPQDVTMSGGRATATGGGTAAGASLAAQMKVKCIHHPIGRAPMNSTKCLTEVIMGDLQREFKVRCEAEEQPDHTNCVVFCVRAVMAMQMAVRGYDIKSVCESQEYRSVLGPKAGEAACAAWEQLWRRVRA